MTPMKYRLNHVAAAAAVAIFALAACQERKPTEAQTPAASSGEYPAPSGSGTAPSSSSDPVAVPGKGTDVTAKNTESGMIGGASGPVASGGKPGSGSTSGAGTGAAVSSDGKPDSKK